MAHEQEEFTIEDAEDAFDAGDIELAMDICQALVERDPEDADALELLGECLLDIDDIDGAEQVFRDALGIDPEHAPARTGLGLVLFELGRYDESKREMERARKGGPEDPRPPWYLGLLAERRGEDRAARSWFEEAGRLEPEGYPPPGRWTDEDVRAAAADAVREVPEATRDYLSNLPLVIADLPDDTLLRAHEPRLSPMLACLFDGQGGESDLGPRPGRVLLFRKNIEKLARTPEELRAELTRCFLYEMVHFLEMEDHTARDLGIEEALLGPAGSGPDISQAIDEGLDEGDDEGAEGGGQDPRPGESDATRGPRGAPSRRGNGSGH